MPQMNVRRRTQPFRWAHTINLLLFAVCVVAGLSALAPQDLTEESTEAPVRIGVFDRQSIVIGYYRSSIHADLLRQKMQDYDVAKAAGDEAAAADIEEWGAALQELAHRQLIGEAPIDGVLESLKEVLPEAARASNVVAIADAIAFADDPVELVNVTESILQTLQLDSDTLQLIRECTEQRQLGIEPPAHDEGVWP